jgi:hypothetical protein
MNIKQTTLQRFRNWCNCSAPTDTFTTGGVAYTREQFGQLFLGEPSHAINTVEENTHADLGTTHDLFDIEEY